MKILFTCFVILSFLSCNNKEDDEANPFGGDANVKTFQKVLDSMDSNSSKSADTLESKIKTNNGTLITIKKMDTSYYHVVKSKAH